MKNLTLTLLLFLACPFSYGQWSELESGTPDNLHTIDFVEVLYGWAAGENGTIVHTNDAGYHWEPQQSNVNSTINSISFRDRFSGWAVGGDGTEGVILYTEDGGNYWQEHSYHTEGNLNSIMFLDDQYGWACGANGIIIYTTNGGINWFDQITPVTETLHDITMLDILTGFAVGDNGTILKTIDGGEVWSLIFFSEPYNLWSIDYQFLNNIFVAGQNSQGKGVFLWSQSEGDSWYDFAIGDYSGFRSIHHTGGWNTYITALDGTILVTTNGCLTWNPMTTGITTELNDITHVSEYRIYACGNEGVIIEIGLPSVDISEHNNDFNIYPVPAYDCVHIDFKKTIADGKISIIDNSGKRHFSKEICGNESINVQSLPQGFYFVHITGRSYNSITRLIIL